jgi:hypothetical protein
MVMVHRFTVLIPHVSDDQFDEIAGKCPDTLTGVAEGQPYVDFSREADSLGSAIDSAIADLRSLGIAPQGLQVDDVASVV